MKKLITAILCLTMVLCLAGCGEKKDVSSSKYIGTWKTNSVSLGDKEGELDTEITLVLNGDGTAVFSSSDGDATNCTWVETSKGFKLKGDVKLTFKEDGDQVKATILGATMAFDRQ